MQQANVAMDKLIGNVGVKIGRQFYGDEGDMIIYYGPVHGTEKMEISAVDAMRFDYNTDKNALHLFYGKTSRGAAAYTDSDTAILGVRDAYKYSDKFDFGGYVYNRRNGMTQNTVGVVTPGIDSDSLYVIGLKAGGKTRNIDYQVEVAGNLGNSYAVGSAVTPGYAATYNGYAVMAKVGYNTKMGFGALNPRASFFYGSGNQEGTNSHVSDGQKNSNFTTINSDLRYGLIFGSANGGGFNAPSAQLNSYGQQTALANRNIINIGVDYTPETLSKLTVGLDYFIFGINNTTVTQKDLGTELDLGLKYKCSENISLGLTGGMFWSGSYYGQKIAEVNQLIGGGLNPDGISVNPQTPAYMAMSNITVKF